jgi:hypothetical protein
MSEGRSDLHGEGRSNLKWLIFGIILYLGPKISVLQKSPTTLEANHYHYIPYILRFPSIMDATRIMLGFQIVIVSARSRHPSLHSTGSSIRQRRFRTHRTRRTNRTRCMSIWVRAWMRGRNRYCRNCMRFRRSFVWRMLLCGIVRPRSKPSP